MLLLCEQNEGQRETKRAASSTKVTEHQWQENMEIQSKYQLMSLQTCHLYNVIITSQSEYNTAKSHCSYSLRASANNVKSDFWVGVRLRAVLLCWKLIAGMFS